jgi:hypothetical protein
MSDTNMADQTSGSGRVYSPREQALLDEHAQDTCEIEMGACTGGCRPSCPPAFCTSERHKIYGVVWPCNVVAPILGFRNADAYWKAENEALDALYAEQEKSMSEPTPGRTRSVRVHLADAPTDVLVWLAQRPGQPFTVEEIAAAVAPADADLPLATAASALATLRAMAYVLRRVEDKRWEVTAEGRGAVVAAMTPAGVSTAE